jgi:hypothetical protein
MVLSLPDPTGPLPPSFFLGQSQVFPAAIQDSVILYVPEIAVLAVDQHRGC